MSAELLDIQPRELKFIFELKKQSSCSVQLVNKTNSLVAFKVKTTSPKKYCVRPNVGIVQPKSTCDFVVTMQAQRVAPPDMICKDKFLVQSTIIPEGTTDEDINSSMFSKDDGKYVEENKLKVLLSPPQSPVMSPVNGVYKQMEDHEPLVVKFNSIKFISPQKIKSTEDISLQKSDSIDETTLPNKRDREDIMLQNNEIVEGINLTKNKHSEDVSPLNNETIKEITFVNNEHCEDISLQKNETIKYINLEKNETVEDTSLQKNDMIEDISLWKNDKIEEISLVNDNDSEDKSLQNKVAADAKESKMGTGEELVGAEPVDIGRMKAIEDLEVFKDVDKMKSKLNELERKLIEAEVMISKLTEERRSSVEERESLRNELIVLKSRTGTRRVQVGFPLLFVVMVALISVVLGYLLHC